MVHQVVSFVRGYAFSKRGRVNGKGGVKGVWTAPPPGKIEILKLTLTPSPTPNLKQNFTLGKWCKSSA